MSFVLFGTLAFSFAPSPVFPLHHSLRLENTLIAVSLRGTLSGVAFTEPVRACLSGGSSAKCAVAGPLKLFYAEQQEEECEQLFQVHQVERVLKQLWQDKRQQGSRGRRDGGGHVGVKYDGSNHD